MSVACRAGCTCKVSASNGADHVIYPEKQVAEWAAIRYTADHIFDYMEIDGQHAIFEVEVPHEVDWQNVE